MALSRLLATQLRGLGLPPWALASPVMRVGSACVILVAAGQIVPVVAPWLFLGVLWTALAWQSARMSEDRFLLRLTTAAFAIRVALALALFYVSLLEVPLLTANQLDGGFWTFAPDAKAYHQYAGETVATLAVGAPPPQAYGVGVGPFYYVLASLYWLLGPDALNGLFFNCWVGAAAVPFAYRLGASLGGRRAGRASAVLIGFWPSALFWSTQLLKDPLVVCLMLALSAAVVEALDGRVTTPERARKHRLWLAAFGVFMLAVSLRTFNQYVPLIMVAAASVTLLPLAGIEMTRAAWRRGAVLAGVWLMLVLALPVSGVLAFRDVFVRDGVEAEFFGLANDHLLEGRYEQALEDYRKALIVNPTFNAGWLNMSVASKLAGDEGQSEYQIEMYRGIAPTRWVRTDPLFLRDPAGSQTFPEPIFRLVSAELMPDIGSLPVVGEVDTIGGLHFATLADPRRSDSAAIVNVLPSSAVAAGALVSGTGRAGADGGPVLVPTVESRGSPESPAVSQQMAAPPSPTVSTSKAAAPPTVPVDVVQVPAPTTELSSILGRLEAAVLPILNSTRQGFIAEGGASTEADVPGFASLPALVSFVPRAVKNIFFSPAPWDLSVEDSAEQVLAGAEAALTMLVAPLFLVGGWQVVRRGQPGGYFLLFVGVGLALLLGLAIPNLGTLFRKKMFALFPLLILAMSALSPGTLRRFPRLRGAS